MQHRCNPHSLYRKSRLNFPGATSPALRPPLTVPPRLLSRVLQETGEVRTLGGGRGRAPPPVSSSSVSRVRGPSSSLRGRRKRAASSHARGARAWRAVEGMGRSCLYSGFLMHWGIFVSFFLFVFHRWPRSRSLCAGGVESGVLASRRRMLTCTHLNRYSPTFEC